MTELGITKKDIQGKSGEKVKYLQVFKKARGQ